MKEKENRIRLPFTSSVRDDFIVDTITERWDLPQSAFLTSPRKLEASLVQPGDEDSHKAPEIESFSFGQLFLELSFQSAHM